MTYVIVPGLGDSSPGHWQSYFETQLDNTIRVQQTNWDQPDRYQWVLGLKNTIDTIEGDFIIIAHSLGCITTLHYVASYPSTKLKGLFLVAPADTEQVKSDVDLSSFNKIPISKLPVKSILISGSNDPWINVYRASYFAQRWDAELLVLDRAKHISTDSGFGKWDAGIILLNEFFATELALSEPKAEAVK